MKKILILFFLTVFCTLGKSQDSISIKQADYYHDSAQSAFNLKQYDTACKYANLHLNAELLLANPRQVGIIESHIILALCEFKEGNYKQSIEVYNNALSWIKGATSAAFSNSFFGFVDLCYMMLEAQDSVFFTYSNKDYRKSFVFSIDSVIWRKGKTFRVRIKAGLNDGLVNEAVAYPISLSEEKGEPERKFQLGKGEIVKAGAWYSEAEVDIYDESDTLNWVRVGDLIETRILSKFKEESTIYKLLANDVYFRNNKKKYFVNPRYIIHYDSKMFQEFMLLLMEDQVKGTEEFTREGNLFLDPAKAGQNQGKSVHDLFLTPDTSDIHDFLEFVIAFPRKYIGKPYKINETYATWLINKSPSTPNEILDSLLRENSLKRWAEILEFNKTDLTKEFYETWGDRAETFADKQLYTQSNKAVDAILFAANYFKRDEVRVYGYYKAGINFKTQNSYAKAINYFDSAAQLYIQRGDTVEYARSIYKKGDTYEDWAKYPLAIENFNVAERVLRKKIGNSNNYGQNNLLAFILWDKGYTVSQLGNNEGALAAYAEAEKILDRIDGSKSSRGTLYRNMGYVLKKQGKYEEALERYKKSGALFFAAGKSADYAQAFDDLADTYFKKGEYRKAITNYNNAYDLKLNLDDKSGAGFSKSNIGQAYWNLGNYDSALLSHKEAVVLRNEGNDVVGAAYSYKKQAALWKEIGNVDSALSYYSTSEKLYISNNDTTDKLAEIKESLGTLYYDSKNYNEALYYYELAKTLYRRIGDEPGVANSLYNIGLCYYNTKSYQQAQNYLSQSRDKYVMMGDKENTMYALIYLSLVKWNGENNFAEAETLMSKALQLAKESNSLTNQGYAYSQIGILQQNQGKLLVSKQYFDSSLVAYQKSEDYSGAGYTNISLGYYYIERGEFAKAREKYWQVANEALDKKNFLLASSALNSLADYYNLTGEYDSAKQVANKALNFNKDLKNEYIEAGNYISLGNTYNYLANNKTAVKYYYKADSIYRSVKDNFSRATPVNNIGTIYFHQGDYRNALLSFNEVYELLTEINYQGDFLVLATSNMGEVYLEDGLLTEADTLLTKSLAIAQKIGSQRGINGASLLLGKLRLKQGDYTQAKIYLQEAFNNYNTAGEKERVIEAGTFLGKLYLQLNTNDIALKYLEGAIALAKQTGNTRYQWEPLYLSANVSLKNNDTVTAVSKMREAVDILENIKGNIAGSKKNLASFAKAQDKYKIYQDLVSILVNQNDVKTAFFYQEKANITGLLEQTRGGDNGPTRSNELLSGLEEQTVAKELELKIDGYYAELIKERSKPTAKQSADKIKKLEELINVNESQFHNFLDSAMKAGGDDATNFSSTINPRQLDDARYSLGDEDVVVEYLATDEQLLIFVATNSSLNARKVPVGKAQITELIDEFNRQLATSASEKETVLKNSNKLYQLFITPIADLLQNHTRIAVVPTGVIYKLPIQSLGREENGTVEYLISKYDITYINNIKFIYQAQAGGMPQLKILAFGNADNTLENAEKEVNTLATIHPTTTKFVQKDATEDKAKAMMKEYNVVHYAIHGRLDPIKFENSYLALAPNTETGDDGKLTMNEIRQIGSLRNVRLLVLSACNTAVKEEKVEGWVNTPANEFILRGVNTVIATQWQVHDEATGVLMEHFYKNLDTGMTFSAALKTAQLSLSTHEKFSHPYYWSAFENIGKW